MQAVTAHMLQDAIHSEGYFAPVCTARHLSVRFYNWGPSRYLGDGAHVLALLACILVLLRDIGPDGVSIKSHLLFLLVFTFRFVNVLFCEQPTYLVIYKVVLWTTTLKIVMILCIRGHAKDSRDTMPVMAMLTLIMIITCVYGGFSLHDHGLVLEVLWIFSNYVEGFAMLPQYIYCYRDIGNRSSLVFSYVLLMGGYRLIFGLTWIFRFFFREYLDMSSMVSGVIGVAFFADYLKFSATGSSPMASACISVDDTIWDAEEAALEIVRGSTFHEVLHKADAPQASVVGRPSEVELHNFEAEVEQHGFMEKVEEEEEEGFPTLQRRAV